MSPAAAKPEKKLFTYQDIADEYQVNAKTVARWFRKRDKESPSKRTVRISQAQLDTFKKETTFTRQTRRTAKKKRA